MDDPQLSRMYFKLFVRDLARWRRRSATWIREHQPALVLLAGVLVVATFAVAYVAHMHGKFRKLKTELKAIGTTPVEVQPMPGGQEAVVMERTMLAEGSTPEFLSATLLPGRGLNTLQIVMSVPGHGSVPLLASAPLEDAAAAMTGQGVDANGEMSLAIGAPLEAPFAGRIPGSRSGDGLHLLADWRGRPLTLPITGEANGVPYSEGGLLLKEGAEVRRNVMPDGGTVLGTFAASNFGGRWPSQTSITVSTLLSSHVFEIRVIARNEGNEPTPIGLGWRPTFLLPGGGRDGVRLRLPAEAYEQMSNNHATGKAIEVAGTALDFTDRAGKLLGTTDIDETFVQLRSGFLDNGPIVEIRDPRGGVGIRVTAMSPQMRALHVTSRRSENKLAIGFQTNVDDPFSRVWPTAEDAGLSLLQPGRTLQWRIRLELFSLDSGERKPL